LSGRFGSPDYAREELRAEIAQVMVCAELDIMECDFSNNNAYVAHWLQKLRDDRKEIFRAAADAQRIADYLLAFHPDYTTDAADPSSSVNDNDAVLAEASSLPTAA
jgi:antirestriction protein ArdC